MAPTRPMLSHCDVASLAPAVFSCQTPGKSYLAMAIDDSVHIKSGNEAQPRLDFAVEHGEVDSIAI